MASALPPVKHPLPPAWPPAPLESPIPVYCTNATQATVYSTTDAYRIRRDFRMIGTLLTPLRNETSLNYSNTVPLLLMPEQVTVLLAHGLIRLIDDSKRYPQHDVEATIAALQQQPQQGRSQRARQTTGEDPMDTGADLVREESAALAEASAGSTESGSQLARGENELAETTATTTATATAGDSAEVPRAPMGEKRPGSTQTKKQARQAWAREQTELKARVPIEASGAELLVAESSDALPTFEWRYPFTMKEKLRAHVFADLWRKGYYMTSASKFGGDFLVYPGEPFRYHSHFVAVVLPFGAKLSAVDLAAIGRLGATVKKVALLCGVSEEGDVHYFSMKWAGIV